ncbi:copper resistance protein CopC [Cryobacterium algoritolerans]|uniref:Copper resistance protein CopC n=1 Tax=Cryobacterium algoritolerans TaxID=1259184 RepID=A0A4R8WWR8_9MICO|nr:copper resistance CopC family protein [Cryobacterium algoritolerans]TFC19812.1 copper resistance protein CopC [Cryobacterium algoritolerans]
MSSNRVTHAGTRRWSVRALGAVVVGAALVGWSAAPAFAHNNPVGSSPAAGAVVTEQPGTFTVTTNDQLLDLHGEGSGNAMAIRGPAGAATPLYYGDGCVTLSGPSIETKAQLGRPGEYTVIWQVVSTDGHAVSEEYTFTWQPAAGQEPAEGSPTLPTCGGTTSTWADAAARAPAGAGPGLGDLAWIGGALGAVVLAIGGTLLVVNRRGRTPDAKPDEHGAVGGRR